MRERDSFLIDHLQLIFNQNSFARQSKIAEKVGRQAGQGGQREMKNQPIQSSAGSVSPFLVLDLEGSDHLNTLAFIY